MSTSSEIMNLVYGPTSGDDLYQNNRRLYLGLSEKLNSSVRADPPRMASLSVHSQYIFMKRHQTPINKSVDVYCRELTRTLPANAARFFPEVQNFLHVLSVTCAPEEFENAVLLKMDIWTQGVYASRDRRYFDLKNHFIRLENCDSPLDLLFRGLFLARARQTHRTLVRAFAVAVVVLLLVLLFRYW